MEAYTVIAFMTGCYVGWEAATRHWNKYLDNLLAEKKDPDTPSQLSKE